MPQHHITTVMEIIDPRVADGLTDAEVIELWLHRQQSPLSRSAYERDIRKLLAWAAKPLPLISTLDLERFAVALADSGLASISQVRTLAAVRSLFRFAARLGYCTNVAGGVDLPRNDSTISARLLSEVEVRRLISMEPCSRNRALMTLLYISGLRVSEACALRWCDLKPRATGQITITGKGRRTRMVSLPDGPWQALVGFRDGADENAPVFLSKSGRKLDRSRVLRIVKEAAARAGVNPSATTHWLRHAHASHALDAGAPIHLVQATLGHASIATTSRYLHARPGQSSANFISDF